MRNEFCPLCGSGSDLFLRLRFNQKLNLPISVEIRHCEPDNFLFVANGSQRDYDDYYGSVANDTVHSEVSGGGARSLISKLQLKCLVDALGDFFDHPKKVLDFGCGEASLLVELATGFPESRFLGFDPGPAAQIGRNKITQLDLRNLTVGNLAEVLAHGPFDLVIASHVVEHLLDFDLVHLLSDAVADGGLLYVEVPNSIEYERYQRREFLYYFDRLHVNHFTPQSLARLSSRYGLGSVARFQYAFPYRDGGEYPALGMLFKKGEEATPISSPSLREASGAYVSAEKRRASGLAKQLDGFEKVLVWGAGDNFFRSAENGGPISQLREMVVLDRRKQEIEVGGRHYSTVDPAEGIRRYLWPVVITISEGQKSIAEQVRSIDPNRRVFFI